MKILFIEDTGEAAYPLKDYLEEEGHVVILAGNCAVAQDRLGEEDIDCLIVDLNMEPIGLEPEEIEQTRCGLLTGWVWLKNHIFSRDNAMRRRTVILTAYDREFKDMIPSEERCGLKVLSKNPAQGDIYTEILKVVNAIGKRLKKRAR